jgi:serine/threonine protein phosphatase PrpC
LADAEQGLFLIVDGMGGHAAGEVAAEVARDVIRGSFEKRLSDPEPAIRRAVTEANNQIYALAEQNPAWRGMACVLTLLVVEQESVAWGHVGDSRLYRFSEGKLRKLTSDHSPVGLQEEQGLLAERAAMRHPDRNQVFRDVGSKRRSFDEVDFVETSTISFSPNDAFLLCSDGLSDALTTAEIAALISSCGTDPQRTAQSLVAAANERSGADNISVLFLAGPEFESGNESRLLSRHAVTRVRLVRKPRLIDRISAQLKEWMRK